MPTETNDNYAWRDVADMKTRMMSAPQIIVVTGFILGALVPFRAHWVGRVSDLEELLVHAKIGLCFFGVFLIFATALRFLRAWPKKGTPTS